MIVGDRLRELREENKYTQADVACILGTTQQLYSNYELGKYELPLRHLIRLAEFYDVSTDYILGYLPYKKAPADLSRPFIRQVTVGEFVCRVSSFNEKSRRRLIDYVNYLTYLENQEKKNG